MTNSPAKATPLPPRIFTINYSSRHERGVAIMLVLFIVILTTALVTSLARSTYLGGRVNSSIEKGLKAEYLVKSALSFAQVIIAQDKTPNFDDPTDTWAAFTKAQKIPLDLLGIDERNLDIVLEITPLGSKFPMSKVFSGNTFDPDWANGLAKLFIALGFDKDNDSDKEGAFKGVQFTPKELVANYVDYVDADTTPLNQPGGFEGREDSTYKDVFANAPLTKDEDLANIPGFTPGRVQKLLQYVTVDKDQNNLNVNSVSEIVLATMIDPSAAAEIIKDRNDGTKFTQLTDITGQYNLGITKSPDLILSFLTKKFIVIAKVDFTTVVTYLRAIVQAQSGSTPSVQDVTIY